MALCCSSAPESRLRRILKAVCAWLAALLFTDSAFHYEGHAASATLTRWMVSILWLLLALVFTWRVFRPAPGACVPVSGSRTNPADKGTLSPQP